jgi:hypothetical protein
MKMFNRKGLWNRLTQKKSFNDYAGKMKVVAGFPPNIHEIAKIFNINGIPVVFAYGDTLYNPTNAHITRDLLIHETTHAVRQGNDVEGWWNKYLNDTEFRILEELEAYANQYKAYCEDCKDRNQKVRFLHRICTDISGPVYGNMIGYREAQEIILSCQSKIN